MNQTTVIDTLETTAIVMGSLTSAAVVDTDNLQFLCRDVLSA